MSDDTSFDEYDDGTDFADIISQLDQQLESAPKKLLPPSLTKRAIPQPAAPAGSSSQVANAKNTGFRSNGATGAARNPAPPLKRPVNPPLLRKTFEKQPFVPANPFINRPAPQAAPQALPNGTTTTSRRQCDNSAMLEISDLEMEEDDTPNIQITGGGGYVQARRSSNEMMPPPSMRAGPKKAVPIIETKGKENSAASFSAMERKELDALRKQMEASRLIQEKLEADIKAAKNLLMIKNGEISTVRKKSEKAEKDNIALLEAARHKKTEFDAAIEQRDQQLRRDAEAHKTAIAFQRQEADSSKRSMSMAPSSARPKGQSTARRDGTPAARSAAMSPSMGRSRGSALGRSALSQRAKTPAPAFAGFHNSFATTSSAMKIPSTTNRQVESESMPPPKMRKLQRTPEKAISSPVDARGSKEKGKGKERMMMEVDEGEEENGLNSDDRSEMEVDDDENDEWEGHREVPDYKGEILSALLKHTTFAQFDTESSTNPTPSASRPFTATNRNTATARATGTAHPTNGTTARLAAQAPTPSPTHAIPAPTFYILSNLRFPPGTDSAVVAEYEEICCQLFLALGKQTREDDADDEGYEFAHMIGIRLEGMARVLEAAGMIGPLVGLLSLISYLVLLFPAFSLVFLNRSHSPNHHHSELLSLLAQIIQRFGRPLPIVRLVDYSNRGKARERSRRIRGIVKRLPAEVVKELDGRVELEAGKRDSLMSAVLSVLEGVAWRVDEAGEEAFVNFLVQKDVIATLLDPNHPHPVLEKSIQFVSLLACRKGLFRALLGVQFYDSIDIRNSSIPLLDRIATLLLATGFKGSFASLYNFQMSLLSLATIIITKHSDAIIFASNSTSLIPEVLGVVFKDTKIIWEQEGREINPGNRASLTLVVNRLAAAFHLFHYLAYAPNSTIKIAEFFKASPFVGLHDRFNVAFGMIAFAGLPDWAENSPEGKVLGELAYLSDEIIYDVSPAEVGEFEVCFGVQDAPEDDMLGEEEMEAELAARQLSLE